MKYPLQVAQLPGNALDQRLRTYTRDMDGIEIHLRSIFLQGTLLQSEASCIATLPTKLLGALRTWRTWCLEQGISLMQGALSIAKSLPGVRYCVVGVDSLVQLEEICEGWERCSFIDSCPPVVNDHTIIDPRLWLNKLVTKNNVKEGEIA